MRKLKTAKSFHRLLGIMICCVLICAALLGAGARDPQQVTATVMRQARGTGQGKEAIYDEQESFGPPVHFSALFDCLFHAL